MCNFAGNQEAVVEMVKDMSSPGLLHSWSSSRVLDEVSVLLHQVSTHVYGYLNVPSPNCGSNLSKGLNNLANSNRLVQFSPKLGSNSVKVEILVSGFFEKHHGRVLTIDGLVNGIGYSGKYGGKDHSLHCGQGDQGESNQKNTNKAADTFVYVGNGSDSLAASLYVPSNDKLVNIHGNSIIQSVFASEKAMASHGSVDKKNNEGGLAVPGDLALVVLGIHPCLYRSPAAGQRVLGSEETERQLC
ncbi:hypothetical protein H5410_022728 [Solanum commersonii]|uniref:Uncharacterized protein n=1 Tax=Solanum commersonii TaxID=4109 RepID=A0A9J5ZHL9_SOLCO|nr:hypothetical protein H5410_022728 [Solanum commersonii]